MCIFSFSFLIVYTKIDSTSFFNLASQLKLTTHINIVNAVVAEEETDIQKIDQKIKKLKEFVARTNEEIDRLTTTKNKKLYHLRSIEYNGCVFVEDINNHTLNVGNRVAIIDNRHKARRDSNDKFLPPRYNKSIFGTITNLKRVTCNGTGEKIFKVEIKPDSGKDTWRRSSKLIFVAARDDRE